METDAEVARLKAVEAQKAELIAQVDSILSRGEKIALLGDKTRDLESSAFRFKATSTALNKDMRWRKIKCRILVGTIVALVLAAIAIILILTLRKKH